MPLDQEQTANPPDLANGPVQVEEPSLAATGETPEIADRPAHEADGDPQTRLQDVLPEITDLAQRVGGLKRLAELIDTLQNAK